MTQTCRRDGYKRTGNSLPTKNVTIYQLYFGSFLVIKLRTLLICFKCKVSGIYFKPTDIGESKQLQELSRNVVVLTHLRVCDVSASLAHWELRILAMRDQEMYISNIWGRNRPPVFFFFSLLLRMWSSKNTPNLLMITILFSDMDLIHPRSLY